jgi:hypothetical protein
MQHNVTNTVLSGFASVHPGEWRRSSIGLGVAPLFRASDRLLREPYDVGLQLPPQLDRTVWHEMSPPDPTRVDVWNQARGAVVVEVGTLLRGGMSSRAVRSTTVLSGGIRTTVSVQALGARWWSEGPLRVGGSLDPALTALILQGALARGGVAASARTAALSLSWSDRAMAGQRTRHNSLAGWAVVCDDEIVAAWLADRRDDWRSGDSRGHAGRRGDVVGSLADRMRRDIEQGSLEGYVERSANGRRDLIVLDRTFRLVDRVAAASRVAS